MAGTAILNVKILTDASDAAKGMDDVGSRAGKMKSGIQSAAAPAAAALAAVGAAAISAGKAAAEDAASQDQLALAMKNATGANDKQVAAMEDYISRTSKAAAVADDELRPAMGKLLRATGDAKKSQEAMNTVLDVSAATGKSVESVSSAMAKGFGGSTTAIGKLVPGMDDAVLASGDMNKIMAELAETTGGAAAKAAEGTQGKMKAMEIAMDEAQETAGAALLPIMADLADVLADAAEWVAENIRLFQIIVGVIAAVAGAVLVVNGAMKVYEATMIVVQAVQKATWLTNPIGLVVLAIMAVVAVVILLWKKSETFRDIVLGVWGAIKTAAKATADFVKKIWQIVWDAVSDYVRAWRDTIRVVLDVVKEIVARVADWIKDKWKAVWGAVEDFVRGVREVVGNVMEAIQTKVGNIADWVREKWQNVWNAVKDFVQGVKDKVVTVFDDIKTKVGDIADACKNAWETAIQKIKDAMNGLEAILKAPFEALKSAIEAVKTALGNISWPKPPKWLSKVIPGSFAASAPTTVAPSLRAGTLRPGTTATSPGGITINVSGAVDPEATARQIRRILAGHNRRIGGIAATA